MAHEPPDREGVRDDDLIVLAALDGRTRNAKTPGGPVDPCTEGDLVGMGEHRGGWLREGKGQGSLAPSWKFHLGG